MKWKSNEAEVKQITDKAEAKAKQVCKAEEAHKKKVSTIQMLWC